MEKAEEVCTNQDGCVLGGFVVRLGGEGSCFLYGRRENRLQKAQRK